MRFARPSSLGVLALLLGALVAPLTAGCGDDVGGIDGDLEGDDGGGGGSYGPGNGASGTTGTGSNAGPGATTGTGSAGDPGAEAPPPIPPEEEPEDVACEDLDPSSPVVLYLSADD